MSSCGESAAFISSYHDIFLSWVSQATPRYQENLAFGSKVTPVSLLGAGEAGVRFGFLIIANASLSPSAAWLLLSEAHSLSGGKGVTPLEFSVPAVGRGRSPGQDP